MKRCVITGANGFIGHAMAQRLCAEEGVSVAVAVRQGIQKFPHDVTVHAGFDLSATTDWRAVLAGTDCVIHTAAHVHVMQADHASDLEMFRSVNVEGTLSLAQQAAHAGVPRFIFVSSIKVNGEATELGRPFTSDDVPGPTDEYGLSKYEAEVRLLDLSSETGMEVVIVRPPLVYGPGVKANFLSLMRCVSKGVPLPLGAINNRRSLVALDNLVDLIVSCIDHPAAANQIFLVSDDDDMSTTELLRRMGRAFGRPARLISIPVWVLSAGAALLGRRAWLTRLCGNLQVDISRTKAVLGWKPPVTVDEALQRTASAYLHSLGRGREGRCR